MREFCWNVELTIGVEEPEITDVKREMFFNNNESKINVISSQK